MDEGPTRRDLLRTLPPLAVGGLAGCSALPRIGSGTRRRIGDWLYRPRAVGEDSYPFRAVRPGRLAALRNGSDAGVADAVLSTVEPFDPAGMAADRLAVHVTIGDGAFAMAGDFDRGTAADRLRDRGFEAAGTDGEYDVFVADGGWTDSDAIVVAGVRRGELLGARQPTIFQARILLRALTEASTGRSPRYTDENAAVGELVERLGDAAVAAGRVVPDFLSPDLVEVDFDRLVGVGRGADAVGSTASGKYVFVFESMLAPDMGAIRAWVGREAPDHREYTFRQEGRVVVVGWEGPVETLLRERDRFRSEQ